jgi:hypothetical protein
MELTPEERQRIYEEEKARLEVRGEIKAEQSRKHLNCGVMGCLGLALLILLLVVSSRNLPTGMSLDDDDIMAFVKAKRFVSVHLKAPGSAKFCDYSEARVIPAGGGEYIVMGHVDSQNGFGAMLRSKFAAKVRKLPNGDWESVEVGLEPQ